MFNKAAVNCPWFPSTHTQGALYDLLHNLELEEKASQCFSINLKYSIEMKEAGGEEEEEEKEEDCHCELQ